MRNERFNFPGGISENFIIGILKYENTISANKYERRQLFVISYLLVVSVNETGSFNFQSNVDCFSEQFYTSISNLLVQ